MGANSFYAQETTNPLLNFDTNDYLEYDKTENEYRFRVGNTSVFEINASEVLVNANKLNISGAISGAPSGVGKYLSIPTSIYTDNTTTTSGTASIMVFNEFSAPTLSALNPSITTTDAATVYIGGAPIAGTNETITNAYSLWVDSGNVRIDGNIIISGTVDGRDVSVDGTTLDNINSSGISALTIAEVDQLENINSTVISSTQWGYLGAMDQSVIKGANVTFGNIIVTGTVDSRDVSVDGTALDNLVTTIGLSALTTAEVDQLENINSTVISSTQWGYLGEMDQSVIKGSNVTFGNIIVTGTVDSRDVSVDGTALDNLVTTIGLSALTTAEVDQLENINSTVISSTQWGYLGAMDQSVIKGSNVTFGNIIVTGTVDGRDVSVDGTALDNLVTTIGLSALTTAEVDQLENINSTVISSTQWGYLGAMDQDIATTSNVQFNMGVIDSTSTTALVVRKNNSGATVFRVDTSSGNIYLGANSFYTQDTTNPLINFDTNDYLEYDKTENEYRFKIGNASIFEINAGEVLVNANKLNISGAISGAPSGVGKYLSVPTSVYTDNTTTTSGTASIMVFNEFAAPTLSALNPSITTTDAATVYIGGAPIAGTNETITNTYSLWVDSGNVRVDGNIIISGTVDGRDVSADGIVLDNINTTGISALTSIEVDQLENINSTVISSTQWGYLGAMDQSLATTSGVQFGTLGVGITNTNYKLTISESITGNTGGQLYIVNPGNDGSGSDRDSRIIIHSKSDGNSEIYLRNTRDAVEETVKLRSTAGDLELIDKSGVSQFKMHTSGNITLGGNSTPTTDVLIDGILECNNMVKMTSTVVSTNNSTGALVLSGGIGIRATANATSTTNGGALTVAGGASINGDLYIGGNLIVSGSSTIVSLIQSVGSNTGTGVLTVTVNIGQTFASTAYKVVVSTMSTTDNGNVYATTVIAKTTSTFKVNIIRMDTLFAGWTDTNLELGILISPPV
jgi:predicted nucleotide-binding protein (sugar kinase/HSP70/actin superfamily)